MFIYFTFINVCVTIDEFKSTANISMSFRNHTNSQVKNNHQMLKFTKKVKCYLRFVKYLEFGARFFQNFCFVNLYFLWLCKHISLFLIKKIHFQRVESREQNYFSVASTKYLRPTTVSIATKSSSGYNIRLKLYPKLANDF